MEGLIGGAFAEVLEARREQYNARFKQARIALPKLDAEKFAAHLRETLAPIVEALAGRTATVAHATDALFNLSLELVGRELLGPDSRYPAIKEGWRTLLPAMPALLAAGPDRMARAVTNALYNLSQHGSVRAHEWIDLMQRVSERCGDAEVFLECGKIAAWRCGMAHYRRSALDAAARLGEEWTGLSLGVEGIRSLPITMILDRLREDPWLDPSRIGQGRQQQSLRIVATVGGFRGFGGTFLTPPVVFREDSRFVVSDEESSWYLHADVFGTTLLRRGDAEKKPKEKLNGFSFDWQGHVRIGNHTAHFAELEKATSCAADETTLAVTIPRSHDVFLVAVAA